MNGKATGNEPAGFRSIQKGALIVGRSEPKEGYISKIVTTLNVSPERQEQLAQQITQHALISGGKLSQAGPRKQRAKKKTEYIEVVAPEEQPIRTMHIEHPADEEYSPYAAPIAIPAYTAPKIKVKFSNEFGQISMNVESIIEGDILIHLLFSKEEDITFIPAEHTTLKLEYDETETYVYYPDSTLPWVDGVKRIMTLFKSELDDTSS